MRSLKHLAKPLYTLSWLPASVWQRWTRRRATSDPVDLIFCLADHFEPSIMPDKNGSYAPLWEQERRLERWCREYPRVVRDWRDADGRTFQHTYFYPAEQYDRRLMERLAEHCNAGWGEVEIHLHHGVRVPDTPEHTRRQLVEFRDALAEHSCLSQLDGAGSARYGFVHGNYALANSGGGRACGVDCEMKILSETGCYADLTLPSAPNRSQVSKINALYECTLPLDNRAPHRRGRDLVCGRPPSVFPLILQGPLVLTLRGPHWPFFSIENSALT